MVTTSGKARRGATGQEVRERNEGENRDAGLLGQTDGMPGICDSVQLCLFNAFFVVVVKTGSPVQLFWRALHFLVICCLGEILLHNKLFQNLNRS